jgi:hypothetical protein
VLLIAVPTGVGCATAGTGAGTAVAAELPARPPVAASSLDGSVALTVRGAELEPAWDPAGLPAAPGRAASLVPGALGWGAVTGDGVTEDRTAASAGSLTPPVASGPAEPPGTAPTLPPVGAPAGSPPPAPGAVAGAVAPPDSERSPTDATGAATALRGRGRDTQIRGAPTTVAATAAAATPATRAAADRRATDRPSVVGAGAPSVAAIRFSP